jgi:rare lipoprotein A
LRLRHIATVAAAAICGSVICARVSAEPLLSFLEKRDSNKPAIGTWQTTIKPLHAAEIRLPDWSANVVANAPSGITTGSIDRTQKKSVQPGPRLNGEAHALTGQASYYWQDQMTATGEHFNKRDLTAAHKTLPFGTRVRVTRNDTGKSVIVRINDRGPYKPGRIIDLSERAAENLGMTGIGVAPVQIEVLGK